LPENFTYVRDDLEVDDCGWKYGNKKAEPSLTPPWFNNKNGGIKTSN
jgi:hypothetical protein